MVVWFTLPTHVLSVNPLTTKVPNIKKIVSWFALQYAMGDSVSSTSMWNILNQSGKHDFFGGVGSRQL